MMHTCLWCSKSFEISSEEAQLRASLSPVIAGVTYALPDPKLCPDCRMQRRMAFRNERKLFRRNSSTTGQPILSMHRPDTPFPVIENKEWWSDANDPMVHGRDIDWNRPFFEQIAELVRAVPRLQYFKYAEERMVNSDYTNCSGDLKDCYLVFATGGAEKSSYLDYSNGSYSCFDCYFSPNCTECYECVNCDNCTRVAYGENTRTCSYSWFLYDCRDVQNSIACVGLRNKKYHILNKPVSEEEFKKAAADLISGDRAVYERLRQAFEALKATKPKKYIQGDNNENVTGDAISFSRDCRECYDTYKAERVMYAAWFYDGKDCMDYYAWGEAQQCYEAVGCGDGAYGCQFTSASFGLKECQYMDLCMYCSNCFGCVGLKKKQYCILNKQYTKEEYEALVPKLIAHMQATGEWGEFFSMDMTTLPYADSVANYFFPVSAQEVQKRGWWQADEVRQVAQGGEVPNVPITTFADPTKAAELLQQVFACAKTGQGFKITSLELSFLLQMGLPLPTKAPEIRFQERFAQRNPHHLWDRPCGHCGKALKTSFDPAKGDTVYCEECYQTLVL